MMIFWLISAALTLAAVSVALLPLTKRHPAVTSRDANDLEVYKDQLRELGEDEARGLISTENASAARLEISRRILKLDTAAGELNDFASRSWPAKAAVGAALMIPVIGWGGYLASGQPQMPDQPIALRMSAPASNAPIEVLLAKTEQHLAQNPNDGKGWEVIAPVYLRLGQFEKAALAFRQTLKLNGASVKNELGLGEALAGLNNGLIGPDAEEAFRRASALAPQDPQPKILLAAAFAQRGQYPQAKAAFQAILDGAPADAPWRTIVEQSIASLEASPAQPAPNTAQPGPTAADIENAAGMSAADRTAMIEGMVANLDEKLKSNPADKAGWLRLIRSYAMLGKTDTALNALARARQGLSGDAAGLSEVNALAAELGLKAP